MGSDKQLETLACLIRTDTTCPDPDKWEVYDSHHVVALVLIQLAAQPGLRQP